MDDALKLIGMMFAFMTPIVGLLGVLVKKLANGFTDGMTQINANLEKMTDTMTMQAQRDAVKEERTKAYQKRTDEALAEQTEVLKSIKGNQPVICRFSEVQVDLAERADRKIMCTKFGEAGAGA